MKPEQLIDPLWRLSNLYKIKRASDGRLIRFKPRPEQQTVFRAILAEGCRRLIILKARRLGMSTAIDLLLTDQTLCNAGTQASIVDATMADAERKLSTICKVALESIPEALRERLNLLRDSGSVLELSLDGDAPSSIFAGLRARGGTNNILHLSEWGVIQADDPKRSEEILTGALPSAEHGVIVIETTWKGGRGGHLWNLVKQAMETPDSAKTERDWRVLFFPWWTDPSYTVDGPEESIAPENARYLADLENRIERKLTPGQKIWYDRQQRVLGLFVFREFPSTIEECFKAPVEGAIYAEVLDRLRAAGGITAVPYDHTNLVHTAWDIGSPVNTVTWYFQCVGQEVRVIDVDLDLDMTPVHRVAHMLAKGYPLGTHYLPHDAANTNTSGRTFLNELMDAGLSNCRTVPRTHDEWIGINHLRQIMPRCTFRIPACERGLDGLAAYHYKRVSTGGIIKEDPVHDWSSHIADALRTMAEADMAGMLQGSPTRKPPPVVHIGFRDRMITKAPPRVIR